MKVISKIYGGLGNQMFQYACGRALANRLRARLYLDISWFDNGNRVFMLDNFPNINYSLPPYRNYFERKIIALNRKIMRRLGIQLIRDIHELEDFIYWQGMEQINSSVILDGYWQNEKYFLNISSIIRKDFTFDEFDCFEAKDIAKKIRESTCSISIHVRRGDYVEKPETNSFHGTCSLDYYRNALQIIINKHEGELTPELFLFSDDPDWLKNNFDTCGLPSVIIDIPDHKDKPYHDMHLMSLCQQHIIANSSFSWWGAWLSSGNGMVIAPKRWVAVETMKDRNPSLESWILI